MALDSDFKALATGKNFATLTTLGPGGQPSTHIMWVDTEDDFVLINTEVHRQKYKNIVRDPRVAVTVWNAANPYQYVEARGTVKEEVRGPQAKTHIDRLAQRYQEVDEYPAPIVSERVILRIAIDKVHKNNV